MAIENLPLLNPEDSLKEAKSDKKINRIIEELEMASKMLNGYTSSIPSVIAFAESIESPAWIKGEGNIMRWINTAYAEKYGVSFSSYYDKKDGFVWDEVTASKFFENDNKVLIENKSIIVEEECTIKGVPHIGTYLKFPVIDPISKNVIGVGGLEITDIIGKRPCP